jgi:hypothetical protein
MDIAGTYALADALPEVFRIEVWQDERPAYNRTAAEALAVKKLFDSLGPNFTAGIVAALPDAMQGAAAPALPIDLLMAGGYGGAKLNYAIDLVAFTQTGTVRMVSSVGEIWNTLDGPQGSPSERVSRQLAELNLGVPMGNLLLMIEPVAQAVDKVLKSLIQPFESKQ